MDYQNMFESCEKQINKRMKYFCYNLQTSECFKSVKTKPQEKTTKDLIINIRKQMQCWVD